MKWSVDAVPDQHGRTALVTGASSGLGLHTAIALAGRGARVFLGCRDATRGEAALAQVRESGDADLVMLDLVDLDSVRDAALVVRDRTGNHLDVLVNNAGVFLPDPPFTDRGHEAQLAVNHLGHAALTWLLMPALRLGPDARVVTVTSVNNRKGLDLDDLNFARRPFSGGLAYAQSKYANLLFALELQRRAEASGTPVRSMAAHPGMTQTNLSVATAIARGQKWRVALTRSVMKVACQPVTAGIASIVYAATQPDLEGGSYIGPTQRFGTRGDPGPVTIPKGARDTERAARLWDLTAQLTGVTPDPR